MKVLCAAVALLALAGCSDTPSRFSTCDEAAEQPGVTLPLMSTDPGFNPSLDEDGDGVACE